MSATKKKNEAKIYTHGCEYVSRRHTNRNTYSILIIRTLTYRSINEQMNVFVWFKIEEDRWKKETKNAYPHTQERERERESRIDRPTDEQEYGRKKRDFICNVAKQKHW